MRCIDYLIENVGPVNFSEKSADNIYYATKRFIPGSAVRGAFAKRYIACNNLKEANTDPVFHKIFLEDNIKFLPAYPVGTLCNDIDSDFSDIEPFILPLSLMRNKEGTKIVDLAAGTDPGAGYKKLTGFAARSGKKLFRIEPRVQISFHMSRNEEKERLRGTSREGHIYNYEYLEPFQFFKGSIFLTDTADSETVTALNELLTGSLRLGRSRNAEYGTCRIYAAREKAISVTRFVQNKPLFLYALTPYIPYGDWQNAGEAADEAIREIKERAGIHIEKAWGKTFAAKDFLNGFVGVWHAKRATVPVLSEGSLFAIACVDVSVLADFLVLGIGQRTNEGFGQFRLWQPLDENVAFAAPAVAAVKPALIPDELVNKAKEIIRNRLLQAVYQQAEKDGRQLGGAVKNRGKHICKRIEHLMDSNKTKAEILDIIENDFKESAKDNLKSFKMKVQGHPTDLLRIFTGVIKDGNGKPLMPYSDIAWETRIGIPEGKRRQLQNDLRAQDVFLLDEDELFRQYWLWVMRHAVKQRTPEGQKFNSQLTDLLKGAKGEKA